MPTGERVVGDASLHVDQRAFADHLEVIQETHDVVALDVLLRRDDGDPWRRPRVSLTFDDAYAGAVFAGFEELVKRNLSATMFVCPGLLGSDGFWWDKLCVSSSLDSRIRQHALQALGGRQADIMSWARTVGVPIAAVPEHARPASEDSLLRRTTEHLVLAAHTWNHPNLARTSIGAATREMERCQAWLREVAPFSTNWLAYPYGFTNREVTSVAGGLFDGAVLVTGGLSAIKGSAVAPMNRLPRINVSRSLSADGLILRLAGILK